MGSSGTGRFSDYSGSPSGSENTKQTDSGSGQGSSDSDICQRKILNAVLEEVALCEYYETYNEVPPKDTLIAVRKNLVDGRIGVQKADTEEIIGYLPTEYNYLRRCMAQGYSYNGQVISSSLRPVPTVTVELEHSE